MTQVGQLLDLPRGLALNRFRIICPGMHSMARLPRPISREERRGLERSIGQAIFQKADFAYAVRGVTVAGAEAVEIECDFDRRLHLFDLRAHISQHASHQKFNVRFGFGGEIQITGFTGDVEIDGLRVQRRLRLRVVDADSADQDSWVIGRHDTRFLVAGSLMDPETRNRAVGEMAERLDGTGPSRGEVISTSTRQVTLRAHDEQVTAELSNYTLTVRSSYISKYYCPQTLSKLQVASGALTPTGKRNRYAVKDRYKALVDAMDQLGWTIAMPNDRQAVIERVWTEIRIQSGVT